MGERRKYREFGSIKERTGRPGFYIVFSHRGRRVERRGGATKQQARKKLTRIRALLDTDMALDEVLGIVFGDFTGSRLTFREAARHYLAYAKQRKKASTYAADERRMSGLTETLWAGKYLAKIKAKDLAAWVQLRRSDGASGSTTNRDLSLVSVVYRWAIEREYVTENPALGVSRTNEPKGREVYLTVAESKALIGACPYPFDGLVLAAIQMGMRLGELRTLRWSDVDLAEKAVSIRAANEKAGRGRTVRMPPDVYAKLARLKARRPNPQPDESDLVFVQRNGAPYQTEWPCRKLRQIALDTKAIPKAKSRELRFHDLRHTAASLMVAAGVPIFDVSKVMGHSNIQTTMRYAHFAREAGVEAARRLGEAFGA